MDQSNLEKRYFISYCREDIDIARKIREDLKKHGFEIWMDKDDIPPGTRWDDFIEKNIEQSIAVLYLVSPTSRSSPNVLHELEYAKIYNKTIFPLWVRGDNEKWSSDVHFGLFSLQYIDLRGEMYITGIDELTQTLKDLKKEEISEDNKQVHQIETIRGLKRIRSLREWVVNIFTKSPNQGERNLPSPVPSLFDAFSDPTNPYKGLHAFGYKDKWSFFGRENLVHKMMGQVRNILSDEGQDNQVSRCMMIVGASGSGKSSLVMAGLLPALEDKKNIPEVNDWFFIAPIRPGEKPMNALAHALKSPFLNKPDDSPFKRWNRPGLRKTLDDPDSHGLNSLLWEITHSPDERIVLIVDQFEEIFAPAANSEEREQFIDLLVAAATEPDIPILLLFTLRADFFHHIFANDTLYKQIEHHLINIPRMTPEELRSVIEKPAQLPDVNVTFDRNLAEDLFHEIRERPESLPLLQFTLDQLFKLREGRRLTKRSYDEIGGMKGAIDKHAEATYCNLSTPEHQIEAKKLFTEHLIYIVDAHDESSHLESGEGITRRPVAQAELQLNDFNVRSETINAFVDARLLTATDITYEISHEALINAWERLREWIKEDRKDIYLIQSHRQRIKQWGEEKNQKQKKELLVEKLALQELQDYSKRKKLDPQAEEFLKASLARRKRQKIRRYLLFVGVTALVILSLMLGLFIRNVLSSPDPTIVTSPGADAGPGTLTYALQKASDGATITFDAARLGGQTICLPSPFLDINKSITIRGHVPASTIQISSCNTGNYISIELGRNVTIENVTFANSYTLKHSIIENAGNLTLNNSHVANNKSYNRGGAIYNTGNLTLNGDIIEKNRVSTDGGAIYNLFGTVSINNNSTISDNEAQGNGGGIYSQGGVVIVGGSHISNNRADSNAGGGIDMVDGALSVSDTQIDLNHSEYTSGGVSGGIGGGIAIVGSVAFITTSVIAENIASMTGGGIAVTKDIGNNFTSLVKLQDIIATTNVSSIHYIGQNTGGDIAGTVIATGTSLQILDDTSIDKIGSPPDSHPVEKSPNYLGVANINTFCLSEGGSYGKISTNVDRNATDIMFTCFNQSNEPVATIFPGQAICQSQYSTSPGVNTVIDRMPNYFDPTSLQCYKNLKRLGPIGKDSFAQYCASQPQYTGLFDNSQYRDTAYDWLCQPKDNSKLPSGLSVTDACSLQYPNPKNDVIDRLANFNNINGWECWEPA